MSRQSAPAFSVQVGAVGPESLGVSGISGTEGLSRLFDFRVDFFTLDGEPVPVSDLVGKDALLTIAVRDGGPRHVHGQVREVESLGMKTGRRRYRAHGVPKLWRLTFDASIHDVWGLWPVQRVTFDGEGLPREAFRRSGPLFLDVEDATARRARIFLGIPPWRIDADALLAHPGILAEASSRSGERAP